MDRQKLKNEFREIGEQLHHREAYDITVRNCSSDNYAGVEFTIEGGYIPVEEVLDVIRRHDKLFVENIGVAPEGDGARLVVFVVEVDLDPSGSATLKEMNYDA